MSEKLNAVKRYFKSQIEESKILFRNIPSYVVTFFVVSVVGMNLLANKTIVNEEWIAFFNKKG